MQVQGRPLEPRRRRGVWPGAVCYKLIDIGSLTTRGGGVEGYIGKSHRIRDAQSSHPPLRSYCPESVHTTPPHSMLFVDMVAECQVTVADLPCSLRHIRVPG